MTYTPPSLHTLNCGVGTDMKVLHDELVKISTEINTIDSANLSEMESDIEDLETAVSTLGGSSPTVRYTDLTQGIGTETALATAGVDLTTTATYYAKFVAPQAMTITGMVVYFTAAYAKGTGDAVIALANEAASPVTLVTYTVPAGGKAAKSSATQSTIAHAALAAGDAIDLVITGSATGTGTARVLLKYTIN